jgi:hypothetical protein
MEKEKAGVKNEIKLIEEGGYNLEDNILIE